jgi:hypothetical protein
MSRLNSATDLERLRQEILAKIDGKRIVSITNGGDGRTRHSQAVVQGFIREVKNKAWQIR